MKTKYVLYALLATLLVLGSCSKDDPISGDGEIVSPDANVPDPDGTVQISMLNNDKTSLDGLYIDASNNFHGDGWMIAPLGIMRGLGNVRDIPFDGWAASVPVTAGNGYVAHNDISDEYIRIFVMENISDPVAGGGTSGAEVKYQKPFKGLDQKIDVDMTTVVLPAEGAMQQVTFSNKNMIPFTVESSADWCKVQKASTHDFGFLYDALVISCDETISDAIAEATVTITTLYGKKTQIAVTRQARGPFIKFSIPELRFNYPSYTEYVDIFTNIDPKDIQVRTDSDWLEASIYGYYNMPRKVRFIEGKPLTRALLDNLVYKKLEIEVHSYAFEQNSERSGNVVLSYDSVEYKLKVIQYGMKFQIEKTDVVFEADSNLTTSIYIHSNFHGGYLDIEKEGKGNLDWCYVMSNYQAIDITAEPNPYPIPRSMICKVLYRGYEFTKLNITQKAHKKFEDQYACFDKNASSISMLYPVPENCQISSTADWCMATAKGTTLTVSVTPATQNRTAVISVAGVDAKVYVSQSKYAVGDNYSENGITGKIYKMDNGTGYIYQEINKRIAWSTQTVLTAGTSSLTDGMANTEAIKKIPNWKNLYPAFAACDALNTNGITGWYLPAKKECPVSTVKVNGSAYDIWSSTSAYPNSAETANGGTVNKKTKLPLTPVHRFNYNLYKK